MQYSIHTSGTTGLYTRDYSEQLWFPLNEIHQPQLLRVNQGKPQLQIKQLMGRAGVMKPPKTPKPTARHHMTQSSMWYQKVCNCRQYCFDLVRSHQCSTAYTPLVPRVYIREITQSSCGFLSMRFISHNY